MLSYSLLALLCTLVPISAQIMYSTTAISSCLDPSSALTAPESEQLNFTALFAQFDIGQSKTGELHSAGFDYATRPSLSNSEGVLLTGSSGGRVLRGVLTGTTGSVNAGYSNATSYLSTLDLSADILTFQVGYNKSALCTSIRSPSAATGNTTNSETTITSSGCPYGPGEVALGFDIPLHSAYPLTTLVTQLVVLDPSVPALTLACYNLQLTPYYPTHFAYSLIHYIPIALLALLLPLYPLARLYAAKTAYVVENETQLAESLTLKLTDAPKASVWATVAFAAMAGRQVVASGSLRRFVTPEFREVWTTIAWFSLVGCVAVDWPDFMYPIFAKNAWANLVYNSSLPFVDPTSPLLAATPSDLPSTFTSQFNDVTSPLYLNSSLPPILLELPEANGISKWSHAVGVSPKDLFSVVGFTFLVLVAVLLLVHLILFLVDTFTPSSTSSSARLSGSQGRQRTPTPMTKEALQMQTSSQVGFDSQDQSFQYDDEDGSYIEARPRPEDNYPRSTLHLAMLAGNLLRLLSLFHLPLTLFAVYTLTHSSIGASLTSKILAGLSLAFFSVLLPVLALGIVYKTPTRRLFSSLPHLLALGPLYTIYAEECSMFGGVKFLGGLVVGATVGAAQGSGIASAAIVLFAEVGDTLVTSLWLPWGDNAAMGPLAFLLSVARIVIAVLLVVLSPTVSVSAAAASWLAYIVLLVQGLVLFLLLLTVLVKLVELVVRFVAIVAFDESRSPRAGGIGGALRRWDRTGASHGGGRGTQKQREIAARRRRNRERQQQMQLGQHHYDHSQQDSTSTAHTGTHMLQPQHRSYSGMTGSLSQQNMMTRDDESGYILSAFSTPAAMSQASGTTGGGGYFRGSYSVPMPPQQQHQQPILRSGPMFHEHATVVPASYSALPMPSPPVNAALASTSTSGFTRVGGGKSSSSNPYQLVAPPEGYPPYQPPVTASSADQYASPSMATRRLSQSAVIELASASSNERPLAPYRPARRPTLPPPAKPSGFFGRFKQRRAPLRDPDSSDDDSASDGEYDESHDGEAVGGGGAGRRRNGGGGIGWTRFLPAGKRRQHQQDAAALEEADEDAEEEGGGGGGGGGGAPAEAGFSVVRRPRPRPQASQVGPAPIVSVEAPSRPSSVKRDASDRAEVQEWGREAGEAL